MRNGIRIGELAARFGLNPKTVRYYEEIGLLPRAERSTSGYRLYDEQDVERLGFIRRAKILGLSLDEIHALLSVQAEGETPCDSVLDLVDRKIRAIDQRIVELQAFRAELATLWADWTDEQKRFPPRATSASICPIIEQQTEVGEHPHIVQEFERVRHH